MKKKEPYLWLLVLAILIFARAFIFTPIKVDGQSMQPTLRNNERGIMLKNYQNYSYGDIIVFKSGNQRMIKRIIALDGDVVEIDKNKVIVNDKILEENYLITYSDKVEFIDEMTEFSQLVEPNSVFVLGDNRLNSIDSRMIGSIPKEDILGKVLFVYGGWYFN